MSSTATGSVRAYYVENNGVKLYCREVGEGTPLVMVHGAACNADFFAAAAEELSGQYRVISYDRRGYHRSVLAPGADTSFDVQVDDLAQIVSHAGGSAYLVGCSAGAVIVEQFLEKYPHLAKHAILHEPPFVKSLEEPGDISERLEKVGALVSAGSYGRAWNRFCALCMIPDPEGLPMTDEELVQGEKDGIHFMETEFFAAFGILPDFSKLRGTQFTLAAGGDGNVELYRKIAREVRERCGCAVEWFPGMHNAARERPVEFARSIAGVFARRA